MYLLRIKTEADKKKALEYIERLPLDGTKGVYVGGWETVRSKAQNAAYWGVWLKAIVEAKGYCEQVWHHFFKEQFLPREVFFIEDKFVEVYPTTTDLSVTAFSKYVEHIHQYASEKLGILLPDTGIHLLDKRCGNG